MIDLKKSITPYYKNKSDYIIAYIVEINIW